MTKDQDNQGVEVAGYCVRCGVRLDGLAVGGRCLDCALEPVGAPALPGEVL